MEARSRALLADNKQTSDHWLHEKTRLDKDDPRDVWVKTVGLHVELNAARDAAGKAGIELGQALQKSPQASDAIAKLNTAYGTAAKQVTLSELRLKLVSVEFEISKREGFENEPDLPALKKEREQLLQKIGEIQGPAASQPR